MSKKTNLVFLTDEELSFLDGNCRQEIQEIVNKALERLELESDLLHIPEKYQEFIAQAVQCAEDNGKLSYRRAELSLCPLCEKSMTYAVYTRNSRYHRKGAYNYDKPYYIYGIDLVADGITWIGHPKLGLCISCMEEIKPYLKDVLEGIVAEIPEQIMGYKPKYKRQNKKHCTKCGWEGHEGEMGKSPTIMGDGYYPSTCPNCKAENVLFYNPIETVDGFVVVKQ